MQMDDMFKALVQNYQFKEEKKGSHPSVDYIYAPGSDGTDESFRCDEGLRIHLHKTAKVVKECLDSRRVIYTMEKVLLDEVSDIAPRLSIREEQSGEINTVYSRYSPLLFLATDSADFHPYVVKPIINRVMAWFELGDVEKGLLLKNLAQKADVKPYRFSLSQGVSRYLRKG